MHRPAFSIFWAVFALIGSACSEEPPAYFAPGTFGAVHRAEIENDCDKRVQCAERTNPNLREDVFEDCVATNATNLNDPNLADFRFGWRLGIARCMQPEVCSYVACVDAMFQSWGESQLPTIGYACDQKQQCLAEMGMPAPDPETCRIQGVLAADSFFEETQNSFTAQAANCGALTSCAFVMCFPF